VSHAVPTSPVASTQPPRELLALYQSLACRYENVHRGQSSASREMTALFEEAYDTVARFIGAPGRANIALYRTRPKPSTPSWTACSPSSATATTWSRR
jgi:Aminotransferase class-V